MVAAILSRLTILVMGILYPAYSSFKAVRRKSHREYTKWMMYWIVFALFQAVEAVTDIFLPWLPLYYEAKILFVLWLVLPITEGSKQMYRLIVHPFLLQHEERIDRGIAHVGKTGLETIKKVSQAGLNKAATTVVSSAIIGQNVLTETLLRAQETPQAQQQEAGSEGSQGVEQTDQAELIPPASGPPQDGEPYQRIKASPDIESFEVIEEDEGGMNQASVSDSGFRRQSDGQVWGNSNNNSNKQGMLYQSSQYYDRTLPRTREGTQS